MISAIKSFIREDDGLGTVEIVIIVAVLVGLALIFRKQLYSFVNQIFGSIFNDTKGVIEQPLEGKDYTNYANPSTSPQTK